MNKIANSYQIAKLFSIRVDTIKSIISREQYPKALTSKIKELFSDLDIKDFVGVKLINNKKLSYTSVDVNLCGKDFETYRESVKKKLVAILFKAFPNVVANENYEYSGDYYDSKYYIRIIKKEEDPKALCLSLKVN